MLTVIVNYILIKISQDEDVVPSACSEPCDIPVISAFQPPESSSDFTRMRVCIHFLELIINKESV